MALAILAVIVERFALRATEMSLFAVGPCIGVAYLFIARGSIVAGFGCVAYTLPMVALLSLLARLPLLKRLSLSSNFAARHVVQSPG